MKNYDKYIDILSGFRENMSVDQEDKYLLSLQDLFQQSGIIIIVIYVNISMQRI